MPRNSDKIPFYRLNLKALVLHFDILASLS
jgi:hypothetical protein